MLHLRDGVPDVPEPLTAPKSRRSEWLNQTCLVKLFSQENATGCEADEIRYPALKLSMPHNVVAYKNNYTCCERTAGSIDRKIFGPGWCSRTIKENETEVGILVNHNLTRADMWWLCGDLKIRWNLQGVWKGQCTPINMVMPFKIIKGVAWDIKEELKRVKQLSRTKRAVTSPGGSFDNRVWIDSIGVPRGVPDEFKGRDQIAAGFESLIFWWLTINKNVDWINYLYYNQQRFVNYTTQAARGLHVQLDKTSLMTVQNRIALDMLLAEKGGVCRIIGPTCCTFIPNNTAPDGSITRALEGLESLSKEWAENSGIDNPLTNLMEKWFGKWSGLLTSILTAIMVAVLGLCGCCCIPCRRGLAQHVIETGMTKVMSVRVEEMTPLREELNSSED